MVVSSSEVTGNQTVVELGDVVKMVLDNPVELPSEVDKSAAEGAAAAVVPEEAAVVAVELAGTSS